MSQDAASNGPHEYESVITHKNPGDKTHVNATWKPEKITEPLIEVFFRSGFVKHPDYVPTVFRYSWRCCCATTRPLVETAAERAATILQKFDTYWENVDSNHILINSSSKLRGPHSLLLQLVVALALTSFY
ncbi:hypothetical protein HPB50_028507 [Hyalomma asiaticum]|nr:hypothetical protein HPB50_028507 [Hyalomma asiaticum]